MQIHRNPYPVSQRTTHWSYGKSLAMLYSEAPSVWAKLEALFQLTPSATYYVGKNVSGKQYKLTRPQLREFLDKHFIEVC